jgi:hypothetical protein
MLSTTLTTGGSSVGNLTSNSESPHSFQAFFEQQQALEMKKKRKKQLEHMQQLHRPKTPTLSFHNNGPQRSQSAQLVRSNSNVSPHQHNHASPNPQRVKPASSMTRPKTASRSGSRQEHSAHFKSAQTKDLSNPRRTSSSSPFGRGDSRGGSARHATEEIHIESGLHQKKSSSSSRRKLIDSSDDISSNNLELEVSQYQTLTEMKAQKKKFIKCVLREDVDLLVIFEIETSFPWKLIE